MIEIEALRRYDRAALAAAYAVECAATQQARPGWAPLGESARIAAWQADNGWVRRLVGAYGGHALVGFASSSTAHDTPDTTWVSVHVDPRHQRKGVGTRLVGAAEEASPEQVSRFVANAYCRTTVEIDLLVQRFAQPLGYTCASTETVIELDLIGAALSVPHVPEGYTVTTYVDGVPEPLRDQVGVLKGSINRELGFVPVESEVLLQKRRHIPLIQKGAR